MKKKINIQMKKKINIQMSSFDNRQEVDLSELPFWERLKCGYAIIVGKTLVLWGKRIINLMKDN